MTGSGGRLGEGERESSRFVASSWLYVGNDRKRVNERRDGFKRIKKKAGRAELWSRTPGLDEEVSRLDGERKRPL
jgi:hypothetical protein